jgi:cell division protein ZipA
MTGLNVLLFLLALIGCAAAFMWGVRPRKRVNRLIRPPRWRRENQEQVDVGAMGPMITEGADETEQGVSASDDPEIGTETAPLASRSPQIDVQESEFERSPSPIIVLCVGASENDAFGGIDIRSAAESVGMRFGASGVFHHFGVGNMQSGESLFCLANMFEPGNFDLDNLATCKTSGLILLMRLPLQIDGAVAFELLLNTAQRLARRLGGSVLNDRHQPLTMEDVTRLRSVAAGVSTA